MSIDHLLDGADPVDAAHAAHIAAEATKDDPGATDAERTAARELLALSVDDLARRFVVTDSSAGRRASASREQRVVDVPRGSDPGRKIVVSTGKYVARSASSGRMRARSTSARIAGAR